jgi:dimethylaniline monooxygenase (N-oxide forming)
MSRPPHEDSYYEFFKAKHTTEYLENYVNIQTCAAQTLRDRIKLGLEVQSVERDGTGWMLMTREPSRVEHTYCTSKLIVASGLTSIQNMPSLPGRDYFREPIIHQYVYSQVYTPIRISRECGTSSVGPFQIFQRLRNSNIAAT